MIGGECIKNNLISASIIKTKISIKILSRSPETHKFITVM
jgi:hypothetical protein